ncbi:hypothetical protein DAPPUDRAFT_310076 [Daphnia pulex]|uniref:Sodium/calcium exchanger membrane region domain-containing protein n=1 Tax=Daphnia pulex TaxID=6669 RepID=E9FSC9_DAPPU|nr:hypothetical protein DAPPUDRAFT_310076 [Daphnia pulex]|eukprot:EFX89188.1 hypothetical protein DAPPUDRAFT_310076 [Daphnia pulex]
MLKLIRFTPEVECRSLSEVDDKCSFIQHTEDCSNAEGLINYLSFLYCNSDASLFTGGVVLLSVWILFLFSGLATAANSLFCPALQIMAEKMKMSDNVAGVTLLALGNGAPDIFSSLAGIRQGRAELAFGELFGAGIFCTTIIAGSISFIKPFPVMQRPFLRDCVFYLAAVYFVFWVFYHRYVHLGHAIGFIALYVVYVLVVIAGRLLNSRMKRNSRHIQNSTEILSDDSTEPLDDSEAGIVNTPNDDSNDISDSSNEDPLLVNTRELIPQSSTNQETPEAELNENPPNNDSEVHVIQTDSIWSNVKEEFVDLRTNLRPFSIHQWIEMKWYSRAISLVEAPFYFILRLSIPLVSKEHPRQGWCRSLSCLQLALTPTWIVWAIGYGGVVIAKFLPLPLMIFVIGLSLGLLLAIFSSREREPKIYWMFSFLAFVVSVIWIDLIANEIMAVLFTFGVVFQLSDAILGLTILAWGNSVGDFAADVSMARQNLPRMGFSACFGAPLLNTLLGLGISFCIVCSQLGESIPVAFTKLSLIMSVFLGLSLVTVFIYLPINGFQANKWLGIVQFSVYLMFVIIALLAEADVL